MKKAIDFSRAFPHSVHLMKKTLLQTVTSKSGKTIQAGAVVALAFDVQSKNGGLCASIFSMTAADGTRVLSRDFSKVGIKVPSLAKLEKYSDDGVASTPFGGRIEPDGWTEGAPSWLLVMGLI